MNREESVQKARLKKEEKEMQKIGDAPKCDMESEKKGTREEG